jgi:putative serine protease PepD
MSVANNKRTYLTKDGVKKLEEKLDYLKTTRRQEVADRIREAIALGDLSENSEYDDAKNEQAFVEGEIASIEHTLRHAEIVDEVNVVSNSVMVGNVVRLKNRATGAELTYTIVGSDESTDVALLKIDPSQAPAGLTPVKLGDSTKVAVGESVVAIGNPLGLDFSLSTGVVSAVGRELQSPNGATITGGIQTDAAINPGNSGGPLFNAAGEVIGINEQIDSQSGGNEGIGFAVPINTAVQVMQAMQSGQYAPQTQDQTQSQDSTGGYYQY